jgi:hypothetical protein
VARGPESPSGWLLINLVLVAKGYAQVTTYPPRRPLREDTDVLQPGEVRGSPSQVDALGIGASAHGR